VTRLKKIKEAKEDRLKSAENKRKRKKKASDTFIDARRPRHCQQHEEAKDSDDVTDACLEAQWDPQLPIQQLDPLPPPLPPTSNDKSSDVPFNTAVVPELFCADVTAVANEIRKWPKKQSKHWNQHHEHHFRSVGCPWKGIEKVWPYPNMATGPVSIKKILLHQFARVKVFCPD
jgi:hypothetical protein